MAKKKKRSASKKKAEPKKYSGFWRSSHGFSTGYYDLSWDYKARK
jgi:hypothetical protein